MAWFAQQKFIDAVERVRGRAADVHFARRAFLDAVSSRDDESRAPRVHDALDLLAAARSAFAEAEADARGLVCDGLQIGITAEETMYTETAQDDAPTWGSKAFAEQHGIEPVDFGVDRNPKETE